MASKHKAAAERDENTATSDAPTSDDLATDITRLTSGLGLLGVNYNVNNIDMNNLHARVEASAALKLLIAKGICTEDEAIVACQIQLRDLLAVVLQIVEEQALRESKSIQTIQRPPIQIARLRD